jgi:hypothetical protein
MYGHTTGNILEETAFCCINITKILKMDITALTLNGGIIEAKY